VKELARSPGPPGRHIFEAKNPPAQFTLAQIEPEYPISRGESIANKDNGAPRKFAALQTVIVSKAPSLRRVRRNSNGVASSNAVLSLRPIANGWLSTPVKCLQGHGRQAYFAL
jgi:hypothetical protein